MRGPVPFSDRKKAVTDGVLDWKGEAFRQAKRQAE